MAFDWNEYISLAEQLNAGKPSVAQMRSAISRAYYGAFNQCKTHLPHSSKKGGDIHFLVINHFKNAGSSEEYSIGNNLDVLRGKRNEADYDGFYSPTWQETNRHIQNARSIINLLISLS